MFSNLSHIFMICFLCASFSVEIVFFFRSSPFLPLFIFFLFPLFSIQAEKKEMLKMQEDLMVAKLNENAAVASGKDHRQRLMEMETQVRRSRIRTVIYCLTITAFYVIISFDCLVFVSFVEPNVRLFPDFLPFCYTLFVQTSIITSHHSTHCPIPYAS